MVALAVKALENPASVFSTVRTLIQPKLDVADIKVDARQKMDGLALLSKLADGSMPLAFFDPQYRGILDKQAYGNEGERQKGRSTLAQMDVQTIREFITAISRVLMPSGHLMLWADKYIVCNGVQNFTDHTSLHCVDMITWNKDKIGMGYRTRRSSEYLLVLQKPPVRAKGVWQLHNIPDVWTEKISSRNHTHSKPLGLQRALIEAVTNKGDTVVDPAAGGYSVLDAANAVGRHFIGCDLNE